MCAKFQNKYRIESARLQGYDYGSNGAYYLTICTKWRAHYFGEIVCNDGVSTMGLNTGHIHNTFSQYVLPFFVTRNSGLSPVAWLNS